MNRLIIATCLSLFGCGAITDITAISDAGSGEQQLTGSLSTWCDQVCTKLNQCDPNTSSSKCPLDCSRDISREFLGHGDVCAQIGVDVMKCALAATCADIVASSLGDLCFTNPAAQSAACGSVTNAPPANTTSPGPNPTQPVVACRSGAGMGSAGNVPIGSLICSNSASDCSDTHSYEVSCTNVGNALMTCTCIRDGLNQSTFNATYDASGLGCPNVQIVNVACGWQLASI